MAVIIDQIISEPAQPRPIAPEPRDRPVAQGAPPPTLDELRFEFLRDAQRKARLVVD